MSEVTILPADNYRVVNQSILQEMDRKVLLSFYEPIIGHLAISLYLTLWNDLLDSSQISNGLSHHHLMSILKCSLNSIKEARMSLESVGLLRTFVKQNDNINNYIYELYSPLTPSEFFNHPILNIVLYNNIGATEYENLQNIYKKVKVDKKDYQEITKELDEVYVSTTKIPSVDAIKRDTASINVSKELDYDFIISSIPKGIINEKAFNKSVKELLNQIAFIYKIDSLKMVELIRTNLNEYGMIDKNRLRIAARKNYQLNNGALPTLIYRTQPEYLKTPSGDNSIRGKIIQIFENTNPVDFLTNKYHGVKPTNRDIKLLEMLLIDLELTPAVVNVLIDYVLKKNNNKLTIAYVETIAGQWKRAGLKTATEAMEFAEKEHKKQVKNTKVKSKKEPVWFDELQKSEELDEMSKLELEELMKEFN